MGAWVLGWRNRGLRPMDSLRRRGAGADTEEGSGGGGGGGLARGDGWGADLGPEVEVLPLLVAEQEDGG